MVWKIEITMNDQLVGFLVRGKLIPGENSFMDLESEPLIIVLLTYSLNQVRSPP